MAPELEQIRRAVEAVTRNWSDDDWHRSLPGKWSTGQILEHLLLTYTGTGKGLRRAIEAGRVLTGKASLPHQVRKIAVTRFGFMPRGRTAFRQIAPGEGLAPEDMRHFYDALVAMDASLYDAERRFGKGTNLLDHPFLGPLNAQEWRLFHRTHTRHHLKQIEERVRSAASSEQRRVSV